MSTVVAGLAALLVAISGTRVHGAVLGASRGHAQRTARRRLPALVDGARRLFERMQVRRRRRAGIDPSAVVDWCESIARRLRSGATLRAAVGADIPADDALAARTATIRQRLDRGEPLADVLDHIGDPPQAGRGAAHLELATATLATAAELGGPAVAALERVGATLRLRAADAADRVSQSAQARLSAHVLTSVPLVMVVLFATTDAEVRRILTSFAGGVVLVIGLALNLAGWWWMRRIIRVVG